MLFQSQIDQKQRKQLIGLRQSNKDWLLVVDMREIGINRDSEKSYQSQQPLRQSKQQINLSLIESNNTNLSSSQNSPISTTKTRLTALDIHRGLTMVGMILVDNSGPYPPWFLQHAEWDGLTPADLIFPSFVFIMGMAVPLAVNQKNPIKLRNFVRIIGLFLIGEILNLAGRHFDFTRIRIMGILQRISLAYGALIIIHAATNYGQKSKRIFGGLVILIIAITYLSLMISFQNQDIGCPKSLNLTPDCNFAGYVDRTLFGEAHIIKPTDPQGLFSTLSTIVTAYGGYVFSLLMSDFKGNTKKILGSWILLSVFSALIAYPLTFLMPLNKKIWSISFAFLNIGIAGISLTLLVLIIDTISSKIESYRKVCKVLTAPFMALGRNPLAIFFLMDGIAILLIIYIKFDDKSAWSWIYKNSFGNWVDDKILASELFSLSFVVLWMIVSGIMYRYKVFIRL